MRGYPSLRIPKVVLEEAEHATEYRVKIWLGNDRGDDAVAVAVPADRAAGQYGGFCRTIGRHCARAHARSECERRSPLSGRVVLARIIRAQRNLGGRLFWRTSASQYEI